MEQKVKILKKLLHSELFLNKFPLIRFVHVNQYGEKNIDVVFSFTDGFVYKDYEDFREEARSLVYGLAKYAGISSRLITIYP